MVALGQVIGNQLGFEGSGIVTRTGPKSKFKIGDRVCGIARGTFKTFARTTEHSLTKIPEGLSWVFAASLPVIFATAYSALYDIAKIRKGESILIHAAAGGVGQACIQLAQLVGAEIYATVGSVGKRNLLEETYGICRDHILSSRDLTFAQGIRRMTNGRGVDVIVNSLSGAALRATWECIAPFGRFVEVGKVDIYSSARLNMEKFKNNVSFEFIDVGLMADNDGPRFERVLEDIMRMVQEGAIKELNPVQVYPLAKLQEALRFMQTGAHSGKIVIELHDDDKVMVSIGFHCLPCHLAYSS
jgi:NADPH:quinone reductase-like Zn-dependent oxidoreductase